MCMLAHGSDIQFLVVKNRGEEETCQGYSTGNQSLPVGSWRSISFRFLNKQSLSQDGDSTGNEFLRCSLNFRKAFLLLGDASTAQTTIRSAISMVYWIDFCQVELLEF